MFHYFIEILPVRRLARWTEFAMTIRILVGRVQNRVVEERIGHVEGMFRVDQVSSPLFAVLRAKSAEVMSDRNEGRKSPEEKEDSGSSMP